jgi:hypothetical protein
MARSDDIGGHVSNHLAGSSEIANFYEECAICGWVFGYEHGFRSYGKPACNITCFSLS